jgi:hypothetical protein
MKRALTAAVLLIALAILLIAGGKANYVTHRDDRGEKAIYASEGSCRHHMSAHPSDTLWTCNGPVSGRPDLCN